MIWTKRTTAYAAIAVCLVSAAPAFAQVTPPSLLQLQGRLTDSTGQPITSTMRDLRVEFYDSAVGGLLLGTSSVVDPTITNGIYAVSVTVPAGVFANNAAVHMEMAVGNGAPGADGAFEVLSPRTRVLAAAYALNADTLDGRDSSFFAQASNSFLQNGNAFGALATLGTNDAFDLVFETGGAEVFRATTAGRVGIGTTTPSVALQVVGQTRSSSFSSADGTAGSPAYRFENDTDVGFFRPAANTLSLATGGAERVTIGPAGEVSLQGSLLTFTNPFGSGTVTTTANAAMTVTSAGAGTLFLNAGATGATRMQTGGADRLYIENNGNVGIGTTAPQNALVVAGRTGTGSPTIPGIHMSLDGGILPRVEFFGTAGTNIDFTNAAGEDADWRIETTGSNFIINAGTGTRAIAVDVSGNVGVGTTTPGVAMDVVGDVRVSNDRSLTWGTTNAQSITHDSVNGRLLLPNSMLVTSAGDTTFGIRSTAGTGRWWQLRSNSTGSLDIQDVTGGGAVVLTIGATGNVGVGMAGPPSNLLTLPNGSATDPIADAWTVYSSRRWKEAIRPLEGALDTVEKLEAVRFRWKADGREDLGMIAEEVGKVVPEAVAFEENGVDAESIDYARITPYLVEAVKTLSSELRRKDEAWSQKVDALERENAGLRERLDSVEAAVRRLAEATAAGLPGPESTGPEKAPCQPCRRTR